MPLAPIALFVYNRPEHVLETLRCLGRNKLVSSSELYIFCDGPKVGETENSLGKIREVRRLAAGVDFAKHTHVITREENRGLAASITGGVTRLTNDFGKAIVLEDDLVTSPGFLEYTNQALDLYENEPRMMHISAYMFPQVRIPFRKTLPDTFAMRLMACWGWGTWKRAWTHFQFSADELLNRIRSESLMNRFNLDGASRSFERQLILNQEKKMNTWAIKWYASILLADGLCLFPKKSLIRNTGNDGSGENSGYSQIYDNQWIVPEAHVRPVPMVENEDALRRTRWFYRFLENEKSLADKIIEKLNLIH